MIDDERVETVSAPVAADDVCMCHHHPDRHLNGTGVCSVGNTHFACRCRRFRSFRDAQAQRREEAFWSKVGKHRW